MHINLWKVWLNVKIPNVTNIRRESKLSIVRKFDKGIFSIYAKYHTHKIIINIGLILTYALVLHGLWKMNLYGKRFMRQ